MTTSPIPSSIFSLFECVMLLSPSFLRQRRLANQNREEKGGRAAEAEAEEECVPGGERGGRGEGPLGTSLLPTTPFSISDGEGFQQWFRNRHFELWVTVG